MKQKPQSKTTVIHEHHFSSLFQKIWFEQTKERKHWDQQKQETEKDRDNWKPEEPSLKAVKKTASETKNVGPKQICQYLRFQHNALNKAERLCKKREGDKTTKVLQDPLTFTEQLFEQPKSGTQVSKEVLVDHLCKIYPDRI